MENESAREGGYALVLSELKAKRAKIMAEVSKIDTAIAQIEDLEGKSVFNNRQPIQQPLPNVGKLSGMTVGQAILTVISNQGKAIHTQEILAKVIEGGIQFTTNNPIETVTATLYKLKKDEKIKSVGRALWEKA